MKTSRARSAKACPTKRTDRLETHHNQSGGCACGAIRFVATGDPARVGLCHCLTCQKAHGAAFFPFVIFQASQITLSGATANWGSSTDYHRLFCPPCGSRVASLNADEIELSMGSFDEPSAMAQALSGRLHALASAHALVRRKISDIGSEPPVTDLSDLIHAIVKAHEPPDAARLSPFSIQGPAITCGDHSSNGIALLVHELATNAAKYGALQNMAGHIAIRWVKDDAHLVLTWTETGGPAVSQPPDHAGFGTTLANRTLTGQFRGSIERDWRPEGLAVTMIMSLKRIAA